ncbi:MAG: carbohydrate ABC transporter substrate-binding protein [Candidatus Dormibacteraeota bacterium]|uniref:Carbohydrate ABC transporter substrate-binding protein n=1 Tax=Candidatus Dormiibacter inghamiae TaxID=3127013 RepID=A0A934KGY5_9BACT|nr:carbohydrate ABC transporter substrate-binding protein [Candidatus Dormibacteraeota bacterium]MBJ7606564.1 carbohydrate ABC transporter substrate-binding protein [Candidatus Dormibacteraeota bacterium]
MGKKTSLKALSTLGLMALLVSVACGNSSTSTSSSPGGKIGGTVHVLAVWSGSEQESFMAVLKPFEDQTGIKVAYESTRDQDAVLTTRVTAGNPPELAAAPSPALLTRFAQQGKVVALDDIVDQSKLKSEYAKSWIDLGTINGKLYQIFSWASLKGLVWYDPKVWQAKGYTVPKTWNDMISLQNKMKADGTAPWCVGLESGAASGWPGSDWVKEIVLGQSGPSVYDSWWQGKTKWTSNEIKSAWTSWGNILGPNNANVYGGKNFMVSTNFADAGTPMFASPPKCNMHNQASFITDFFTKAVPTLKTGEDFNFFPLPSVNSKYDGAHVVSGDTFSVFKRTPQSEALIKYLATAEAQAIWVKRGGKISPNNKTNLSDYPDAISKQTAQLLTQSKIAKYDAGDLMPADMKNAYWTAVLNYVQDESKLDSILAGLDKVQASSNTG